jgi:hypothetical protein
LGSHDRLPAGRYADAAAWLRLEQEVGRSLPADYKAIVDAYAPVQLNGHLCLSSHPACAWRNLSEEIRSDADGWTEWRAGESEDLEPHEDPRVLGNRPQLTFGTPDGFIPIASTDQGAAVYPGPVLLEYLPTGPGRRTREVYGPERGM